LVKSASTRGMAVYHCRDGIQGRVQASAETATLFGQSKRHCKRSSISRGGLAARTDVWKFPFRRAVQTSQNLREPSAASTSGSSSSADGEELYMLTQRWHYEHSATDRYRSCSCCRGGELYVSCLFLLRRRRWLVLTQTMMKTTMMTTQTMTVKLLLPPLEMRRAEQATRAVGCDFITIPRSSLQRD
jgi:hypothetical protein